MTKFISANSDSIKKVYAGSLVPESRRFGFFYISEERATKNEDGSIKYAKKPCTINSDSEGMYIYDGWSWKADNSAFFLTEAMQKIEELKTPFTARVKDKNGNVTVEHIIHIGLAYVTTNDQVWLDFDHAINDDGSINPGLKEILRKFDCFAEMSVSGHGCHVMLKSKLPENVFKKLQWEKQILNIGGSSVTMDVFGQEHIIYITGIPVDGYDKPLLSPEDAKAKLNKFFEDVEELTSGFDPYTAHFSAVNKNKDTERTSLTDEEIAEKLSNGLNNKPISALSRMYRCDPLKEDLPAIASISGMTGGAHKFNFSDAIYRAAYRLHFYTEDVEQAIRLLKTFGMYSYMQSNGGSKYIDESVMRTEISRAFEHAAAHGCDVYSDGFKGTSSKKSKKDDENGIDVFTIEHISDWYKSQNTLKICKDSDTNEYVVKGTYNGYEVDSLKSLQIQLYSYFKKFTIYCKKADVVEFLDEVLHSNIKNKTKVHVSFAYIKDVIYHDIGDGIHYVKIDSNGWNFISADEMNKENLFFKARNNPYPVAIKTDAKTGYETLAGLKVFDRFNDEEKLLVIGWLLQTFTNSSHMHLNISAEAGSGKSSVTNALQMLADPDGAMGAALPRNPDEIAILCSSRRVASFDNQSKITAEISDRLCQLATGGVYETRKLFTNGSRNSIKMNSAIILNGISLNVEREDLSERTLSLHLNSLEGKSRYTPEELEEDIIEKSPVIMGFIYDVLSNYLKVRHDIPNSQIRLAEAIRLVQSAERSGLIPYAEGSFEAAFKNQFEEARKEATVSNPLCEFIYHIAIGETTDTCKYGRSDWFDVSSHQLLSNSKLFDNRPEDGYVKIPAEVFYTVLKNHVSEYKSMANKSIGYAVGRIKKDLKSTYSINIEKDTKVRGHMCYVITIDEAHRVKSDDVSTDSSEDISYYPSDWDDDYNEDDESIKFEF